MSNSSQQPSCGTEAEPNREPGVRGLEYQNAPQFPQHSGRRVSVYHEGPWCREHHYEMRYRWYRPRPAVLYGPGELLREADGGVEPEGYYLDGWPITSNDVPIDVLHELIEEAYERETEEYEE